MLLPLKDFLLNDKILLFLNEAYRNIYPFDDEPFLNVVNIKEYIFQKLPKIIIKFESLIH